MKYRWLLGLLVSLTACGKDDDGAPTGGSGGSTGQVGGTAGSSTKGGSGGGVTPSGGTTTTGGTTTGGTTNTPTAGTAPGTGGASKGGTGSGGSNTPNGGAATAGTSTGGQASAGAPPNGGSGGAPPTSAGSVLERNGSPTREGHWIQPGLTKAAAAKMVLEDSFKATFQGRMFASPLYAANGPGGKGVFVAVSADNVVAALDETTGATVWTKTLGTAPGTKGQACGFGSDPVGILSTPVIDEKSKTLYVAAAVGVASSGKGPERHELHALSLDDGSPRQGWPVNVNTLKADGVAFNAPVQNQRSALSLVNGIVYVGYGGFVGDCGDYRGWIVAVDAADPTKTGAWATRGKGDAIWAAGGFASDGTNIFPVTGNYMGDSKSSSRDVTDSEAILKISGLAKFERNDQNQFYPSTWKSMDAADADFGGSNSILVRLPGATPERVLVAVAKDGKLYLVDPNDLGGENGHVDVLDAASVGSAAGSGVRTAPTAYTTSKGTYVAFSVQSGANCPNSMTGAVVMGVRIEPGGPTANVEWCAAGGTPYAAPIATTSDGKADAIVWYVTGSQLRGVDGDTGTTVAQVSGMCSGVEKWTSPIAVKNRIVVGGSGKLCSWKPQ